MPSAPRAVTSIHPLLTHREDAPRSVQNRGSHHQREHRPNISIQRRAQRALFTPGRRRSNFPGILHRYVFLIFFVLVFVILLLLDII